jgi:hypothetical protein
MKKKNRRLDKIKNYVLVSNPNHRRVAFAYFGGLDIRRVPLGFIGRWIAVRRGRDRKAPQVAA